MKKDPYGNIDVIVVGGGLAGSEAAWQLAQRGVRVALYEMRPVKSTPAHVTDRLAELVCSNSLGAQMIDRASGLLQEEMRRMGSLILAAANKAAVPAGGALAVDREVFAETVTRLLSEHPLIEIRREEVTRIPTERPTIIATGPLTSEALAEDIKRITGEEYLYFYDAMAPIVEADSIDMSIAFRASRYGRGEQEEGDYINCPMTEEEYKAFVKALLEAETIQLRDFEREDPKFFERCLPIEEMARRGEQTLAFGPMRPVGLIDPRTGEQPYAVVQLRQDNIAGTLYNMVGFQTNLKWGEQARVFRMIPGLQNAEFVRMGQMHRNTFINSPVLLEPTMQFRKRPDLFFAGQITGVEGYVGNAGTGLVAGINAARLVQGKEPIVLPRETMLGALCWYVTHADPKEFQPMKANFGILPPLPKRIRNKRKRNEAYAKRALETLETILPEIQPVPTDHIITGSEVSNPQE
ncbi:methylenetetrahydrofolate--tRNA-(uracil-5-)-methyltransferase [Ardenticatena maritima]|uniref:Methylenetetrahydrofolate--tRNA-(uracil-5-)-methyltransferase TrmFO n=2 Tax=Ardenticatena maritima TaxID=872965 RepID=A0A0M8K9K3_9CHLR|nr:methylenetetrahydrofolate--tRNA-(uracil-5-)-methyltransferase [Ardenticatena maritima]